MSSEVETNPITLRFVAGTLEVTGMERSTAADGLKWDDRSGCHRAAARHYSAIVRALVKSDTPFVDEARRYSELDRRCRLQRTPRPYQTEAVKAWRAARSAGLVVLPTGSGKTHMAVMAIDATQRAALVVTPTLDLVRQWYDVLRAAFGDPVGVIGGGEYDCQPLTVTTYDSAYIHMENIGAKFGLVVFDECHHLPGAAYALSAELSLAPYRLGLTATLERADGRDELLTELIGPTVYRKEIGELSGGYLAEYETVRTVVRLSPDEQREHDEERAIYLDFLRKQRIHMGSPRGWSDFIMRASRTEHGQRALKAYRRQRQLALAAPAKLTCVEQLLELHRSDRTLIFTSDNRTAYAMSRRFLIPIITHQTKIKERSHILEAFADGRYTAVATSKVLNEGVDVPDANVAIVVSGSGSVREHVQRLGRILRPRDGKRATLYELVTAGTSETGTSERRREHSAYQG